MVVSERMICCITESVRLLPFTKVGLGTISKS